LRQRLLATSQYRLRLTKPGENSQYAAWRNESAERNLNDAARAASARSTAARALSAYAVIRLKIVEMRNGGGASLAEIASRLDDDGHTIRTRKA
jgi:hypothetical protein